MSYGPGTNIKFRFENNVAYTFLVFFTVFLLYYHLAINVYADFWIISRACIHAHHIHTHAHTLILTHTTFFTLSTGSRDTYCISLVCYGNML